MIIFIYENIKMANEKNLENIGDDVCEELCLHEDAVERAKTHMIEEDQYSNLAEFLKIFGNPTRLKIISLLCFEDLCVCDICEALDLNQTTCEICKRRKDGKILPY